jgi:magnesium transporter
LVAATIISTFETSIAKMAVLAALGPMVAGVGGNAGTQTMAIAVRAIATNQLTRSNTWRTIVREIRVALLNGVTVAIVIGIGVSVFFHDSSLGLVIAIAMLCNILIAGLAGVLVPVSLDRLDVDPAVSSSIFVTMITDSMGYLAFLGLAFAAGLAH